jgi:hypothetical protein
MGRCYLRRLAPLLPISLEDLCRTLAGPAGHAESQRSRREVLGPAKRRVRLLLLRTQEELCGSDCAVGLDLRQRFLSLDSPEPQRLADVLMQRP